MLAWRSTTRKKLLRGEWDGGDDIVNDNEYCPVRESKDQGFIMARSGWCGDRRHQGIMALEKMLDSPKGIRIWGQSSPEMQFWCAFVQSHMKHKLMRSISLPKWPRKKIYFLKKNNTNKKIFNPKNTPQKVSKWAKLHKTLTLALTVTTIPHFCQCWHHYHRHYHLWPFQQGQQLLTFHLALTTSFPLATLNRARYGSLFSLVLFPPLLSPILLSLLPPLSHFIFFLHLSLDSQPLFYLSKNIFSFFYEARLLN